MNRSGRAQVYPNCPDCALALGAGSTNANENTNPDGNDLTNLVRNVFTGFQSRDLTRADGDQLKYYGSWQTTAVTTDALIQSRDGRCNAWARFFIDVLRAQGGNFTCADNAKGIRQRQMSLNYWGFLVNGWNFQAAGMIPALVAAWNVPRRLGYTHANQVTAFDPAQFMNQNQYTWVGGNANAGFTDQPGIPGQNSPNPQSLFPDHAVVQIGNTLYDPSYGATYDWAEANPLGDFQAKAIAGILGLFPMSPTGPFYLVARAPAANEMNQLFILNRM